MDLEKYLVRPFEESDYGPVARLSSLLNPETPSTEEEERHWDRAFAAPHLLNEKWTVEERASGEVIAEAVMAHSPFSYEPTRLWVHVLVHPAHQGRGVGRTLCTLLENEAKEHRLTTIWTSARKDSPRSIEFARRWGFEEVRSAWMSTLDLSQAPVLPPSDRAAKLLGEGIRFSTFAAEGARDDGVRRRVFDLLSEAGKDAPRVGPYTPISFEQFEGHQDRPGSMPEGFFLACDGESYVGMTDLEVSRARPDAWMVGFTGTRAAYRGRGIASELKRRAVEFSREQGIRYLRTFNDSLNLRMWAINERLGFRRTVEWSQRERQLTPSRAPARTP